MNPQVARTRDTSLNKQGTDRTRPQTGRRLRERPTRPNFHPLEFHHKHILWSSFPSSQSKWSTNEFGFYNL
ncbi:hypothetical protein L484_011855 [Morus notabilis]|uniref:Uncharacterized protein n=1 Tax=Morus notabilis TaxID=981085 RepID=W9S9V9_9ROSA|nr:hypothetical protein L484_011855 [Morus notabilis]